MEVIALFYFVIVPSFVIGFFVCFFWFFRKWDIVGRLLLSIGIALIVGYFSPCIIPIPIKIMHAVKETRQANQDYAELVYFQNAIQGKYDNSNIRDHYKNHPFPNMQRYKSNELINRNRMKVSPDALQLLIELFDTKPYIKGFLASQPEARIENKLTVADLSEYQAVLPMAIDSTTPAEVLIKLASHESIEISRAVNNNSNAPLAARYIYFIRSVIDEKERYLDTKKLEPPGLENSVGKYVWESLACDKREYVRLWIAKSYAPPQILKALENDSSNEVLKWVFLNSGTPKETIKLIAKKFNTNQNDLMERFSRDPDNLVRQAVTQSPHTSAKTLIKLMQDKDVTVSGWADSSLQQRGYDFDHSKVPPLLVKKPQRAF